MKKVIQKQKILLPKKKTKDIKIPKGINSWDHPNTNLFFAQNIN